MTRKKDPLLKTSPPPPLHFLRRRCSGLLQLPDATFERAKGMQTNFGPRVGSGGARNASQMR